ncbi:type II toxin-antitoxin system RelE/ParE family toxin [Komagataeibacter europaeus]|uniref:type II toxin-antitoxin system RelE/ParE family toxin n=1 Tax=Komagataeibacter europaeus TaxID=33995 RepID=UPI000373F8E7|nr:type II toxin-antitoxin system RelE/ParE family toxin [Komagataeibacter europaeus]GBQ45087.1 plasmid stabilization system protein [Komagataeibacter europaeus LMG 18890]
MKYIWLPQAQDDLHELTKGFENPETARRIIVRLASVPDMLVTFPRIGTALLGFAPRDVRRFIVDDYEIRYEIRDDLIMITNVFHTRQDRYSFH